MREITYDEKLEWMAGYNIYKSEEAIWRYVYGYSYESNLRNIQAEIRASSVSQIAMLSLTIGASALALLF